MAPYSTTVKLSGSTKAKPPLSDLLPMHTTHFICFLALSSYMIAIFRQKG